MNKLQKLNIGIIIFSISVPISYYLLGKVYSLAGDMAAFYAFLALATIALISILIWLIINTFYLTDNAVKRYLGGLFVIFMFTIITFSVGDFTGEGSDGYAIEAGVMYFVILFVIYTVLFFLFKVIYKIIHKITTKKT